MLDLWCLLTHRRGCLNAKTCDVLKPTSVVALTPKTCDVGKPRRRLVRQPEYAQVVSGWFLGQ